MSVQLNIDKSVAYVVFDQPDSKANVLSSTVLMQLRQVIEDIPKKDELKAVVFQSAKQGIFIAGANIEEIQDLHTFDSAKAAAGVGQALFNAIEDLSVPTIAVINGAALGGGCELALACDYRVALDSDKVKIGLPEVNLGFVPGFGGTWRLPKVVGLSKALELILTGKPVDVRKAYRLGLVDVVIPETLLEPQLDGFINSVVSGEIKPKKKQKNYAKGVVGMLEQISFGRSFIYDQSRGNVLKNTKGNYPAPIKAIDVVSAHLGRSRDEAMDIESSAFAELAIGRVSKNCVHVFQLTERCRKLSVGEKTEISINKCAVLGAGIMGGGIAQLLSQKGIWVRLKDINWDAIAMGLKAASKVFDSAVKRRRITEYEKAVMMGKISGTVDFSGFHNVNMVIEAVVENMDIKRNVLEEVERFVPDHAIICSNTSSLSVTEMGWKMKDQSRLVGFHFFNPVHRMPLIEIIKSEQTSEQTLSAAVHFAKRLGKMPILVNDAPGFLVNRILLAYINEAGRLLEEGYSIEQLDQIMEQFGMPMGPFTLSDEVGLDVGVKVLQVLQKGLGDRFAPTELFTQILEKGFLGKKSGKGFYVHGKKKVINTKVVDSVSAKSPSGADQQALDRMIFIMIIEAARCLQDKVVQSAHDVDAGMVLGTGFPPFRGGLLKFADAVGVDEVVFKLEEFDKKFQDGRFKPCNYLLELREQGKSFYA